MSKKLVFAGLLGALMALPATFATAEVTDQQFNDAMKKYLDSTDGRAALGKAVEEYFKEQQQQAAKQADDRMKAELENQFKSPVKIDAGKSPSKGPADAAVTIIEFSDFQCPYCSRGKQTMDSVLKEYEGKVRVVFKNLPLPFHPEAEPSAKAALAAHRQGKFWEFHDKLFDNQGKLGAEFYTATAKELGLDMKKFEEDMKSEEIAKEIKADMDLAQKNGIQGTPGFFVNGVAVRGAYPLEHFKTIIDRWLEKKTA